MANANVSRLGQANLAGASDALFVKVFIGFLPPFECCKTQSFMVALAAPP